MHFKGNLAMLFIPNAGVNSQICALTCQAYEVQLRSSNSLEKRNATHPQVQDCDQVPRGHGSPVQQDFQGGKAYVKFRTHKRMPPNLAAKLLVLSAADGRADPHEGPGEGFDF